MHGGPFANIAHGCNSILATRMAMAMGDYAVTEAGFAFDLGGEKFFDLKCRIGGLNPAAIVLVATVRALKMHGGVEARRHSRSRTTTAAVERGLENLAAHLDSATHFGKPTVVAVNRFGTDTPDELEVVHRYCAGPWRAVRPARPDVFGARAAVAIELAETGRSAAAASAPETPLKPLYPLDWSPERKIEQIARVMYGADKISILPAAAAKLRKAARLGYGDLADLHGQDPELAVGRPEAPRPTPWLHPDGSRRRDRRRRRLPRRPDRRHRPDAGITPAPRRRTHRRRPRRADHRPVLNPPVQSRSQGEGIPPPDRIC